MVNACRIWLESLKGEPLGRTKCGCEDIIKRDLVLEGVDWIHFVQDTNRWWTLGYTVIKFRFQSKENFLTSRA